MITVGSDGSVITDGGCGNAPGDGDSVGIPLPPTPLLISSQSLIRLRPAR